MLRGPVALLYRWAVPLRGGALIIRLTVPRPVFCAWIPGELHYESGWRTLHRNALEDCVSKGPFLGCCVFYAYIPGELHHESGWRTVYCNTLEDRISKGQFLEALDFAHQCGVIHGDINGFNVLLDRRLNAKLADFAGSLLDGSPLLIGVTASYEYPGPLLCTEADIFALGSTLYELMNESRPHAGLSDTAIEQRYKRGEFAETESLGIAGSTRPECRRWGGSARNAAGW